METLTMRVTDMTGFERGVKITVLYRKYFYAPDRHMQENLTSCISCNAIVKGVHIQSETFPTFCCQFTYSREHMRLSNEPCKSLDSQTGKTDIA